jgi:aryl-alcohol dehydrogenase-like predicted oxidoreductase
MGAKLNNRLALGTVQFGLPYGVANQDGQVSPQEAEKILNCGFAAGLDTLDTAIAYGNSEQRLGEIGVARWRIVSKLPPIPDRCADVLSWARESVSDSLSRLGVDRLYGLLLHSPRQLLDVQGPTLYAALQHLKMDGVVEKIGISIYAPQELDELLHRYRIDLVQAPFNVLDRRLIVTGWLDMLRQANIEVHARSVFLQGLLLMDRNNRPLQFDRWAALWAKWDEWLVQTRLTPLQACLRFALSFPQISKVIVGVESLHQLEEILSASVGPPPEIPDGLSCSDNDLVNPARWPSRGRVK